MISASDLVRISDFKHYYFLIEDTKVKVGDKIYCDYAGCNQPAFEICDKKIGSNYDLGYCCYANNANNVAYFIDKCKLRITYLEHEGDTLYIHVEKKLQN